VNMALLNETHFEMDQALRFINHVCQRTDCPTEGGGTEIHACRGIDL
jgi:hypothetical protein